MLQTYTQPPLQCPGLLWRYPVAAFFCAEPSEEDKNAFYDRLAVAVLAQALLDAGGKAESTAKAIQARAEARAWLLDEGATWARLLGKRITQGDIESLAATGWQLPGRKKRRERTTRGNHDHDLD